MGHPLVQALLPTAAIATVLIVTRSTTVRAAWGRLCLINGIVGVALAVASVSGRSQPLWPADLAYERALDQAMQWWLGHLMWTAAAYVAMAMVVAAGFFALSYWLLHWPRGQRDAR